MREIPLTRGLVALVDDEDYDSLNAFKWYAAPARNTFYPARNTKAPGTKSGWRPVFMHIVIMQPLEGQCVDHRDGNGLDNRRSNLRAATPGQNSANVVHLTRNTSGFRGVCWDRSRGRWIATIEKDDHQYFLGRFDDREDAARAYDDAARRFFGEFARLNLEPAAL